MWIFEHVVVVIIVIYGVKISSSLKRFVICGSFVSRSDSCKVFVLISCQELLSSSQIDNVPCLHFLGDMPCILCLGIGRYHTTQQNPLWLIAFQLIIPTLRPFQPDYMFNKKLGLEKWGAFNLFFQKYSYDF